MCYHTAMTVEARPEPYPDPPKQLLQEISLGTALRRIVDDLFTYQAIAERLHGIAADNAIEQLIETWKQGLTHHLEETAQASLQNVVAVLDLIQAGGGPPITVEERQDWQRIEVWYHPFAVMSLCREDLRGILGDDEIAHLSDSEMKQIADRLSDAYRESSNYRENLEGIVKLIIQPKQTPEPTNEAPDQADKQPDQAQSST